MFDLENFMIEYGNILKKEIQRQLDITRTFSLGYNKDAYSNGRKLNYAGNAPKAPFGISPLSKNIDVLWNDETQSLSILMLSYWKYVNFGRKPGKYVPIGPLEQWAQSKGFENPRGAAFGISKNIKKFGIQPTNFYGMALDNVADKLTQDFTDNADDMIDTFFDNLFEDTFKNAE